MGQRPQGATRATGTGTGGPPIELCVGGPLVACGTPSLSNSDICRVQPLVGLFVHKLLYACTLVSPCVKHYRLHVVNGYISVRKLS